MIFNTFTPTVQSKFVYVLFCHILMERLPLMGVLLRSFRVCDYSRTPATVKRALSAIGAMSHKLLVCSLSPAHFSLAAVFL